MKLLWTALGAMALGACAPTSRPAPPPPPAAPSPPPAPPEPEPVVAAPENPSPEIIRDQLFREYPQRALHVASMRIVESDGAVTLIGFVPDQQTAYEMLATVRHVPGVRSVRNELIVLERRSPETVRESRTGEAIRSWLRREQPGAVGPDESFGVYEQDGFVVLYGKVNGEKARLDLVSRVKQMPDVKEVDDRLEVEGADVVAHPPPKPAPR